MPFILLLFFVFLMRSLNAVEIPAKDLSNESPSQESIESPLVRRALPVHTTTDLSKTSHDKSEVKLELALREIQLLRKAAQAAGGDLEVIIRPTGGITAESLVIPLTQTGAFEVKPGRKPGAIRIESKSPDAQLVEQSEEIAQLRKSQNELMDRIQQNSSPSSDSNPIPTVILKSKSTAGSRPPLLP